MTIDDAVGVIGEKLEEVLEENEDVLTWDMENDIKNDIINNNGLENIYSDTDEIEMIYAYEMFENENISSSKKIQMLQTWITSLEEAGIEVDLDISSVAE